MSNELLPVSYEFKSVLAQASQSFSARDLRDEIERVITQGPAIKLHGAKYAISRKAMPEHIWTALLELEDWDLAHRVSDSNEEETLFADKTFFELIIEALRLLLERFLGALSGECEAAISPTLKRHSAFSDVGRIYGFR